MPHVSMRCDEITGDKSPPGSSSSPERQCKLIKTSVHAGYHTESIRCERLFIEGYKVDNVSCRAAINRLGQIRASVRSLHSTGRLIPNPTTILYYKLSRKIRCS